MAEAGISLQDATRCEEIAKHKTEAEQYLARCEARKELPTAGRVRQIIKRERRTERELELADATTKASKQLGHKLYNVIYIDPPWHFQVRSEETGSDRAAENHYPTMTFDELAAIKLPAAKVCALFMWATVPMLPQAIKLMELWGFEYQSGCVWIKPTAGTGYWFCNQVEHLLLGTRGRPPAPAPGKQPPQIHEIKRGKHSVKPTEFADMIAAMFPNVSKLEMFARNKRPDWDVWGNEV